MMALLDKDGVELKNGDLFIWQYPEKLQLWMRVGVYAIILYDTGKGRMMLASPVHLNHFQAASEDKTRLTQATNKGTMVGRDIKDPATLASLTTLR